jgi:hypothetical protein
MPNGSAPPQRVAFNKLCRHHVAVGKDAERVSLLPAEERDLATELARLALEQAAPEEIALFPETTADYFRDPQAAVRQSGRDEAVGFGLELALLTPYLLAVATAVVRWLSSLVQESVEDELRPRIGHLVHRLFRGAPDDDAEAAAVAPLSPDQLHRLRDVAYARGIELGLDGSRASLLADSVVGRLVTA